MADKCMCSGSWSHNSDRGHRKPLASSALLAIDVNPHPPVSFHCRLCLVVPCVLFLSCFRTSQGKKEVLLLIDLLKLPKRKASTFSCI